MKDTNEDRMIEEIAEILRTELKLPADAAITGDTALVGGDHDLDSLDVLMLVTATEKRFGVKIPNDEVGPEAFRNVRTLADLIRSRLEAAA